MSVELLRSRFHEALSQRKNDVAGQLVSVRYEHFADMTREQGRVQGLEEAQLIFEETLKNLHGT